ncbi:MAG: type II toxin-antitoxin system YafQ family toxin [Aulosira sp. ZfuVER01]|nr:type II toxin-antitoxin system mRNA interferase toxin, RelE/StbE family [Aulosira sp. ZfuVER01]MDZ7998577.1 type II toxin-antitoxin system mRNA interferase toxin, RelE/StbE family [Aulosira sp. DedVER01a]MDZ8052079.1 type II toxin-antitoxin system mRNA interferase toxin, RelE/StbE family [Aulosira sp. ZfuCHP01]
MNNLVWSSAFIRTFKRLVKKNPELRFQVEEVLQQMLEDPFQPTLGSHQLKDDFYGQWSCSINYSTRILFKFVANPDLDEEEILLLTLDYYES